MTDPKTSTPATSPADTGDADRNAGVKRPDQKNNAGPGKTEAAPATGGKGAAGAGGPAGFGT